MHVLYVCSSFCPIHKERASVNAVTAFARLSVHVLMYTAV